MDKTSMLWRVLQLLLAVQERPGLSVNVLAEHCEISPRTVYRYINILRMAGVPLVGDNGYRITGDFYIPPLKLTLLEALSLILSGDGLRSTGGSIFGGSLNGALGKILATIPEALKKTILQESGQFLVGTQSPVDYSGYSNIVAAIQKAQHNGVTLAMKYQNVRAEKINKIDRLVDPYGLVLRGGFCYLVGYCHKNKKIRMFRVDRIVSLYGTVERYKIPDNFSLDVYMSNAWSVMRGPAKTIRIRFTGEAARLTEEANWHPSQTIKKEGNSVVAEYKSGGLKEICAWLLKFGGEAEVLEPLELRHMVAERANAALRINNV